MVPAGIDLAALAVLVHLVRNLAHQPEGQLRYPLQFPPPAHPHLALDESIEPRILEPSYLEPETVLLARCARRSVFVALAVHHCHVSCALLILFPPHSLCVEGTVQPVASKKVQLSSNDAKLAKKAGQQSAELVYFADPRGWRGPSRDVCVWGEGLSELAKLAKL